MSIIETFITQLEAHRTSLVLQLQLTDQLLAQLTRQPVDPAACQHPEEQRINLSVMGGPKAWLCKICDHEHREGEK